MLSADYEDISEGEIISDDDEPAPAPVPIPEPEIAIPEDSCHCRKSKRKKKRKKLKHQLAKKPKVLPDVIIISDDDLDDRPVEFDNRPEDEVPAKVADDTDSDAIAEELLEQSLPDKPTNTLENLKDERKEAGQFVEIERTVLDEPADDNFDLLPESWIRVNHVCGIPIYLHRSSRVCVLSKPYFLGSGDLLSHRVPASSIPCFQSRGDMQNQSSNSYEECTRVIRNIRLPIAKVETVQENLVMQSIDVETLRNYWKKTFKSKMVTTKSVRKKRHNDGDGAEERPSLPKGTKLISFPVFETDDNGVVVRRKEWVMNPGGRSYVNVFHEFLQQACKLQPEYVVTEAEGDHEYVATIIIDGNEFGKGSGNSKRIAKLMAAKETLEIIIPELKGKIEELCGKMTTQVTEDPNNIFDEIKITDPRIPDLCNKTTEPSPYSMLLTCLRRNWGTSNVQSSYHINPKRQKTNEFILRIGKHHVSVPCKNKRDGKQKAAQLILQKLHPRLDSWGSLIRVYGNESVKNSKEKKIEAQEITQLQTQGKFNEPNWAILNKLESELSKLYDKTVEEKEKIHGKFIISDAPKTKSILSTVEFD